MKRLSLAITLAVLLLALPLLWLLTTESGLQWGYRQAAAWLPETLSLQQLEGRLIGPLTVSGIEFEQDGTRIAAGQIDFDWQPLALLAANIDISRLQIDALNIELAETAQSEAEPARTPDIALPDIHLPWRMRLSNAAINGASLKQGDQTFSLNQIRLSISSLFSQIDIEELGVEADAFSLAIRGELQPVRNYSHALSIDWQVTLPSSARVDGRGQLRGDLLSTRLKQSVSGPLQATLDATLTDVLEQLNWQTRVDITRFETALLDASLPALGGALKLEASGDLTTAAVTGTLQAQSAETDAFEAAFDLQRLGDNTIQLNRLNLRVPASDTSIISHGSWQPAEQGGAFDLALNWNKLRWPITGEALFNSASGEASVAGTMAQYRIRLSSDSPWPELLPSSWNLVAEGDANGLTLQPLRVTALDGETVATGRLDWLPELSWQLEVSASEIDPGRLWPEWPGQLAANLASKGRLLNGELQADADISRVTGRLRDYPVSLQSQLGWHNNGLDITRFDFHSGDARVSAEGRLADSLQLKWSIAASDLAELYPDARGQLAAEGALSGPQQAPTIQATVNGRALSLLDYSVASLDAALSVDLFRWQQLDIRLDALAVQWQDFSLQSLTVTSIEDRIEANAVSEKLSALLRLRGKPDASGWQGHLETADIISQHYHNWSLDQPSAISLTADSITIEPLCWTGSSDGQLCTTLQRQAERWQLSLDASRMPMLLLGPWLPDELKLEGNIDATAGLQLHAPDRLRGQARLVLLPGAISYPLLEGERDRWDYQGGTLAVTLYDQGITIKSDIAMGNGDRLQFNAELPGAELLALDQQQQSVRADAQLTVHDLGLIEALIPEVQDLKGEVELKISASGSLAEPRLSGRARLLEGSLRVPRLGLSITQLSLNSQSHDLEKLDFRLDARSGDGDLLIQGQTRLNRLAGWPSEIRIKGNDFEVSSIPEARVQVSPDMQVRIAHRRIDIKGEVDIPYAKLQPRDITTASRVSDDAVIIGGELPPEENWLIYTRLRLTLGERVSFYGFGFEGRFGGSLLLEDEPGQLTRATGEISIPEGRYRAYGQRLDVEHGRLLYTGGPLTNPGLDLRAVRRVDNVTAGIKVRGSLNQPQLELFSSPAMGQTDMLAYIMLGGPIENASGEEGAMMAKAALALGLSGGDHLARTLGDRFGLDEMRVESSDSGDQASLVVGRYLSPRLYVSYGVGLIESINTLALRYKITDKWQLKAESGEYQGADLLYTFER